MTRSRVVYWLENWKVTKEARFWAQPDKVWNMNKYNIIRLSYIILVRDDARFKYKLMRVMVYF
jgi:hypothetical protein